MIVRVPPAECQFAAMAAHGEGARLPLRGGTVVLSDLPGGRSAIRGMAPSVKFLLEGEEVYRIGGRTHRLGPGDFLLAEAGTEFEVRTSSDRSIGMCIYLGAEGPPLGEEARLGPPVLRGSAGHGFAALLDREARHLRGRIPPSASEARALVARMTRAADAWLADFRSGAARLRSAKLSTRIETMQRLERARGFIHAHAGRPLTLDEIAGAAALSRFHLTRCFAEAYGAPPLAYHRAIRLDAALERIRRDEASPTQLSEELGYASLSAFTRAFRQKFGMPPSAARRAA